MLKRAGIGTSVLITMVVILTSGTSLRAETIDEPPASPTWGVGLDFISGASIIEAATKDQFRPSLMFGGGVEVGLVLAPGHVLSLRLEFLKPLGDEEGGSLQVQVTKKMRILNPMVLYARHFRLVHVFTGIGPSLALVTTTTQLYDLGDPVIELSGATAHDDVRFQFPERALIDERKDNGVSLGVGICLGASFDIGKTVGLESNFFVLKIASEYAFRNGINEIYAFGALSVVPTSNKRR